MGRLLGMPKLESTVFYKTEMISLLYRGQLNTEVGLIPSRRCPRIRVHDRSTDAEAAVHINYSARKAKAVEEALLIGFEHGSCTSQSPQGRTG